MIVFGKYKDIHTTYRDVRVRVCMHLCPRIREERYSLDLDLRVDACNPNTQETGEGGSQDCDPCGLHSKTLSQNASTQTVG